MPAKKNPSTDELSDRLEPSIFPLYKSNLMLLVPSKKFRPVLEEMIIFIGFKFFSNGCIVLNFRSRTH